MKTFIIGFTGLLIGFMLLQVIYRLDELSSKIERFGATKVCYTEKITGAYQISKYEGTHNYERTYFNCP